MPSPARASTTTRRRWVVPALVVGMLGLTWAGFEQALAHADEACYATPKGYLVQTVVEVRRTRWTVDCVMDPGNGDPRYVVHRPWQSPRPIVDELEDVDTP